MSRHAKSGGIVFAVTILSAGIALLGYGKRPPKLWDGKSNLRFAELRDRGRAASRARSFSEAAGFFEKALVIAKNEGDSESIFKLSSNIGSCRLATFNYRDAIRAFLEARTFAKTLGNPEYVSLSNFNLASAYNYAGDLDAAGRAADQGLAVQAQSHDLAVRHQLQAILGILRAGQQRTPEAETHFLQAIDDADRAGNVAAMAQYWDQLGEERLLLAQYSAAEQPLTEAFRLRTLFHQPEVRVSLLRLAWLRLEQGDPQAASALMHRADLLPAREADFPPWLLLYLRGRILQAQNNTREALPVFRLALQTARQWQEEAAPSGILGTYAQQRLDHLYRDFVDASLSAHTSAASQEAFEATELDRIAAFDQIRKFSPGGPVQLPPEYVATEAKLRAARIADITVGTADTHNHVEQFQQDLDEISHRIGLFKTVSTRSSRTLERNTAGEALRHIQTGIRAGEALLSFHMGDPASVLWAVSRTGFKLYRLPARDELWKKIQEFRAALQHPIDAARLSRLSNDLYLQIFGCLDEEFRKQPVWIITAEDKFFEVPFSALVVEMKENQPVYLVQQHAIMQTPSAGMLTPVQSPAADGPLLAVGDGIYNSADVRWKQRRWAFWTKPAVQLSRLVSSAQEIKSCARAWNGSKDAILLTGDQASRGAVEAALRAHPSVLHFATHVLAPEGRPNDAAIDLGLTSAGKPDFLTIEDIEGLHVPDVTVVMSGCSSAANESVATSGVLGLTRAWLIAGARVIIGSRWSTPDDTGELFQSFYSHLQDRRGDPARFRAAAQSLQLAQLEMLNSQTWRSDPKYWSAFYVFGKE